MPVSEQVCWFCNLLECPLLLFLLIGGGKEQSSPTLPYLLSRLCSDFHQFFPWLCWWTEHFSPLNGCWGLWAEPSAVPSEVLMEQKTVFLCFVVADVQLSLPPPILTSLQVICWRLGVKAIVKQHICTCWDSLHVIPPKRRIRAQSDWVTPIKSRGPLCFLLIPLLLPSPCHDSMINHQWHNRRAHVPVAWPTPSNLYILIRIRQEVNNEWGSPSGAANSILLCVTFHSHHSQLGYWV